MTRHVGQVFRLATLFGFAFALLACGGGAEQAPAPSAAEVAATPAAAPTSEQARATFSGEPIRLGLQVPLSGPQAAEGFAMKQAVELVVHEANAGGGVGGREVILLVEDDRGEWEAATRAAERLVAQGVIAVIGSTNGVTTTPAAAVYNQANVLHLMPSCALPLAVDMSYRQSFRLCFPEERTADATADFITELLDAQRVAVLHDGSIEATALAGQVQQAIADQGAEVVAYETGFPPLFEQPALMNRLLGANPDVVYFAGTAGMAAAFVRQAREYGLQVAWVFSNSTNVPELATLAGPEAIAGAYLVVDPLPGILDSPAAQRFVAAYRSTYTAEPTLWGAMAADSFLVVQEAIRATNSTDPQVLASYLVERLRGYPGITGQIEGFDSAGNRIGTGDVVLVLTPDGRAVLAPQQP